MCGRFTHLYNWRQLHRLMALTVPVENERPLAPRYNVPPTKLAPVVRQEGAERRADLLRWGLVPSWSKSESAGGNMINARGETVATSAAFRAAFRKRRCVVPVSGFYEWDKLGGGKIRQPVYFEPAGGNARTGEAIFPLAGLWEFWKSAEGAEVLTFTIITTSPNELLETIHDRMPVILPEDRIGRWLDPAAEAEELQSMLVPFPAKHMSSSTVSTRVNTPAHDDARCIEANTPSERERGLFE